MTLSNGRQYHAIPGPSVVPDRVLRAMHRPSPNIYEGELVDMMPGLICDLNVVADTRANVAVYICNGHGLWEACLSNTLSRGDKVLVLFTGSFAQGWADMARAMGIDADVLSFGLRSAIDPARVSEALEADTEGKYRAVLMVQVDTSTSVRNDVQAVRKALDAAGHPALLMVDSIACLACDEFHMDAWGVDVMIAASQKGLMTPPGMGFVWYSAKADAARDRADCATGYWDWRPRTDPDVFYQYFCGTAPTHHLYGLREALTMLVHEEGLESVWSRHATLARAVWAACDAWGAGGPLQLNVADPASRSHAVTTLRIGAPYGTELRNWVDREAGVTLGIGLGLAVPSEPDWHGNFRIGHMGHVNAHMVLGVLATIEAGMRALDIPHGQGAMAAAAAVCAGR